MDSLDRNTGSLEPFGWGQCTLKQNGNLQSVFICGNEGLIEDLETVCSLISNIDVTRFLDGKAYLSAQFDQVIILFI